MLPPTYYHIKGLESDSKPSFPRWIYFDMDGTIADLYNVPDWLAGLQAGEVSPYLLANPIGDSQQLMNMFNRLKARGYHLGIISWGAKGGTAEYTRAVKRAKVAWLNEHYPQVFEEIHVVKHGTPKHSVVKYRFSYLVDDEANNLKQWGHRSINAKDYRNLITGLTALVKLAAPNRNEVF